MKVYLARSMSFRIKTDVVAEAKADKQFFEDAGITVLDPVSSEGVKAENSVLQSSKVEMDEYWKRDKAYIREANAVLDMTPTMKSEGVSAELGYARYFLYKPIIRVFPLGKLPPEGSVAWFEGDCVVDSLEEAIEYLYRVHGTWLKRFSWRLALYRRCWLKSILYAIETWFN